MLFGSTMLEVALALILIYALIGVVCAGIIELIEILTRQRAKFGWYGIMTLFDRDQEIARQISSHPLIRPLGAGPGRWPLSIPARSFALALLDIIAPSHLGESKSLVYFADRIAAIQNEYLRRALLSLSLESQNTSDVLTAVGSWYDSTMERVTGALRRRVYLTILVAAFLLSLLLNADTINIANSIPRYVDLRATVLSGAVSLAEQPSPTPTPTPSATPVPTFSPLSSASPSTEFTGSTFATPAAATPTPIPVPPVETLAGVRTELNSLYLPIGWSQNYDDPRTFHLTTSDWIFKILGILITTLIASIIGHGLVLFWRALKNRQISSVRDRKI